jgi:ABC-2 type transport system permease protein
MTVGFILGVAFNAPLAFGASADVIIPDVQLARQVSFWGLATHFSDFGRGVISLSSIGYFLLITVLGLYLCMVLIGARHWSGGRDGDSMLWHYLARTFALAVGLVGLVLLLRTYDRRFDATLGKVSSLSPKTKELIRGLEPEHPVVIDAFVSAEVPERYVQTRFNLVSLLREFDAMSGGKIDVRLHQGLEPFSDEAVLAEQRFGIQPTLVRTRTRGAFKDEEVILGAAFTSGLEKVVVPFFDYGIPVEYELIRSIGTVSESQRERIGVVRTDAQLWGGFSFAGGMPQQIPKSELVLELEKQYDVEEVDPASPISQDSYDMLLVVQPSSLSQEELTNVVNAVRAGQPTAIFEDPQPSLAEFARVPGTGDPKQAPGGMFGGGAPMPKGNIRDLWAAIGIEMPGEPNFQGGVTPDLAWQEYLPYLKLQIQGIPDEWVFASNDAPLSNGESLNPDSPITAGLGEILLPLPGVLQASTSSDLKFTPLVQTSTVAGRIRVEDFRTNQSDAMRLKAVQGRPRGVQVLAAHIQGVPRGSASASTPDTATKSATEAGAEGTQPPPADRPINVVYVADIDLMISAFLRIRARPEDDEEIDWRFENVNFLLNIVDVLSGSDDYVEIRRRKPHHSTLKVVEERARQKRDDEFEQRLVFEEKSKTEIEKIEEENRKALQKFQERVDELNKKRQAGEQVSLAEFTQAVQQLQIAQSRLTQKLEVAREGLQRERDDSIKSIQRETDLEILRIQNRIKFLAVALPPIPPLLVGLVVFVRRRLREREGVSKARLK